MYAQRAPSVPSSLCLAYTLRCTFEYVVLEGRPSLRDDPAHHASISRLHVRLSSSSQYTCTYTYRIPTSERSTGPVSGDNSFEKICECRGQCIIFDVNLNPRRTCLCKLYRCGRDIGNLTVEDFNVTGVPLFMFAFLVRS